MKMAGNSNKHGRKLANAAGKKPAHPLYNLSVTLNNGTALPLASLKGKKVLLVNTASECGYTGQYTELQQLADRYKDQLEVIGFPANDFKEQEKASDEQIAQFCTRNFGVQFPLAKKTSVVPGPQQHPLFAWLTNPQQNGWNNQMPDWNFSKYLVDEQGVLTHYFGPAISPLSGEVTDAVNKK
jgi:glutathione peroxidase